MRGWRLEAGGRRLVPPSAFSLAETAAALGIVLLLVTITITWYAAPVEDTKRSLAAVEARHIAEMIEAHQLANRAPYASRSLPPRFAGRPEDPWQNAYRVDPELREVRSAGPDGVPGGNGAVDDIVSVWQSYAPPPRKDLAPPRVTAARDGAVSLEWEAPAGPLQSLRLRRTGPEGTTVTPLSTASTAWSESGLRIGQHYTYRLEALLAEGATLVSGDAPVFFPISSPPSLAVDRDRATATVGGPARFRFHVRSHGAELQSLQVGETTFALSGVERVISYQTRFDTRGTHRVEATLADRAGATTSTELVIDVR